MIDEHAMRELDLYAENTAELYPMKQTIIKNLARKQSRGTYDHALAAKAWMHWLERAAGMYYIEFGGGRGYDDVYFERSTLKALSRELADRYRNGE